MNTNRKAQIRMSETIAVLFIFFVLILFGMIFYFKYSQVAFQEKQEELLGKKAIEITLKSLFLPELICSKGEAEPEDNCFDMIKLREAQKVFRNKKYFSDYYFDLFPFTKINVTQIYPKYKEWILYDKPKTKKLANGTKIADWTRLEQTHFIITLKDELKRKAKYSLGVLTVGVYS